MIKRFTLSVTLMLVLALLVPLFLGARTVQAASGAKVYVVHGINGSDLGLSTELPVDISVDGACALPNFVFGQITDAINLPAGTYSVAIRPANSGSPCAEAPILGPIDLTFADNSSYAVVAHLDGNGNPTASLFTLNTASVRRGMSRIIAFHTAAAPVVDLRVGRNLMKLPVRALVAPNFANGDSRSLDVPAGRWQAALYLPGTLTRVFGPANLVLFPQNIYLVFAVGNFNNGTFTLLTKVIR